MYRSYPDIYWRRLVIVFFLVFLHGNGLTQVYLFNNESPATLPQGSITYYLDTSKDNSLRRYTSIRNDFLPFSNNQTSFSFKNKSAWLQVKITELNHADSLFYFMIRNPHINYLRVWFMKGDSLVKEFPLTGDRIKFSRRFIYHPDFVFPLPKENINEYSIILVADKRNELLTIPIHFLTEDGFLSYNRKKNLLAGLVGGLSIFLFCFNLFLFFQMRERLYVFYGLYILMGLFYIFSDYGYSFMYLFPSNPLPADYMRPISICLATPLYLLFSLELLCIRKTLPQHNRWMIRGLVCYGVIFAISIPFLGNTGLIRVVAQNLMQFLLTSLVLANFVIAIKAWRKKVKYAPYIVITSFFLFATISLFVLYLSGDLPDTFLTRNLMNIGFTGEISILAFALSLRFKHYKEQSEELLRKSSLQQEQIFKTVTDYQEKELQRLSSLLHDSVGARLSALRLNLESGNKNVEQPAKMDQVIEEVTELANDVRQFSHRFSPILLQKKGLRDSIQQFINHVNESDGLYIQFEMIGSIDHSSFRYELLIYNILQELIQNTIKHSGASEGIVQLLLEDDLVSIFVEDNGKGFDVNKVQEGLGFLQIKQLVTFVNGTLRLDSTPGKGSRISIEFTVLPDERNLPDSYSR
jgi:signal transduction histidine kinase